MKRHNRAALAVAALALVIPVSGCASLLSPHQTAEYHYNGGDGASGSVGDVEVRGLMLITDEKGSGPAQLFFTLINKGDSTAKVSVEVGAEVAEGDTICVLEAMKMENNIAADKAGTVTAINVEAGQSVSAGDLLATID